MVPTATVGTWRDFQHVLESASADGELLLVRTETGSVYGFRPGQVRRAEATHALCLDGEWLPVRDGSVPVVGEPMMLWLEPLGSGITTLLRETSRVTRVCWVPADGAE